MITTFSKLTDKKLGDCILSMKYRKSNDVIFEHYIPHFPSASLLPTPATHGPINPAKGSWNLFLASV